MPATTEASSRWRFETCITTMPCGAELLEVDRHGLAGEQMDRDRVGGEGIDDDEVVGAVGRLGQREPRVAEDDRHIRPAFRQEAEQSSDRVAMRTIAGSIS